MKRSGESQRTRLLKFVTDLVAELVGNSSDLEMRKAAEIQQLTEEIMSHGQMLSHHIGCQTVGVEVEELAFRLRETTQNIVTALVLLEGQGRANRTRAVGYWTLHSQSLRPYSEVARSNENRRKIQA
jgi:hypothetical protein